MFTEKPQCRIDVYADARALASAAADQLLTAAESALSARGRFVVALSGGSTPRALFQLLATPAYAARIDWFRTFVFWGDERAVPPESEDSNYRAANALLLSRVPIPPENVRRIAGELTPSAAALAYEATLREFFAAPTAGIELPPLFDLALMGMGPDGHIASLFPGGTALHEASHWVVPSTSPFPPAARVTLTVPVLNAARLLLFLIEGADKAGPLAASLYGARDPDRWPLQRIAPHAGRLHFILDRAAARDLPSQSHKNEVQ